MAASIRSTSTARTRLRSSYRLYLRWRPSDRFIKLPILLVAFIIYLITTISLRPIGIDLDRPYIFFNPSFVNLNWSNLHLKWWVMFYRCFMSILIMHSVRLRHVASWVDLLASENCSLACYHGLCDSTSHPTVSTVDCGSLIGRSVLERAWP